MNLFFISQAIKLFSEQLYTEDELRMIYDYLITIDNHVLDSYISDEKSLLLYLKALNLVIKIYENREEYEKCFLVKKKVDITINLIKKLKAKDYGTI